MTILEVCSGLVLACASFSAAYAQSVSVTSLTVVPDYSVEESDRAELVAGADGILYGSLSGAYNNFFFTINSAGQYARLSEIPQSDLVQGPDGTFYGSGFRLTRSGALTVIHNFSGEFDGAGGRGAPTLGSDGYFYAIAAGSGVNDSGNGGVFYRFSASGAYQAIYVMNSLVDGDSVIGTSLVQASDGKFYGVAEVGGDGCPNRGGGDQDSCGTVFRVSTGGVFEVLHSFSGGADGAFPSGLTAGSDRDLYGYASEGGDMSVNNGEGDGTLFKVDLQGDFSVVHTFEPGDAAPIGPYLAEPHGSLYGVPINQYATDTSDNFGVVYTDGRVSSLPASFAGPALDGAWVSPFLAGPDGNLYGIEGGFGSSQYWVRLSGRVLIRRLRLLCSSRSVQRR